MSLQFHSLFIFLGSKYSYLAVNMCNKWKSVAVMCIPNESFVLYHTSMALKLRSCYKSVFQPRWQLWRVDWIS